MNVHWNRIVVILTRLSSWWRHQMETFSALLAPCTGNSPVTAEFPSQRPESRSFDVFFDLRLKKCERFLYLNVVSISTHNPHPHSTKKFKKKRKEKKKKIHCRSLYWRISNATYRSEAIPVHMITSSNGSIFRVTGPLCGEFTGPGEFPAQRPVTRSFDVFFDLRQNKRLSKQPWGWWFETLP